MSIEYLELTLVLITLTCNNHQTKRITEFSFLNQPIFVFLPMLIERQVSLQNAMSLQTEYPGSRIYKKPQQLIFANLNLPYQLVKWWWVHRSENISGFVSSGFQTYTYKRQNWSVAIQNTRIDGFCFNRFSCRVQGNPLRLPQWAELNKYVLLQILQPAQLPLYDLDYL